VPNPAVTANPNFAALLLAGGRSTRMGTDKAALHLDDAPLWQRQLATLRALAPAELYISGRRDGPFAAAGVEIIEDLVSDLGPLGGFAAAFARIEAPRVLVLAIDLPLITPDFLRTLLAEPGGVIPQRGDFFEPLAALYPRTAAPLAHTALQRADRSMQRFCRELIAAGFAQPHPLTAAETLLFRNLNEPADLPPAP